MKAVILAGGFGTRLKDIAKDVPKPMVPIVGKPFLQHQIRLLKQQGLTDIVLAVHHMSDKIKDYFGNGKRHDVDISYAEEEIALGTAGAIKNAQKYLGNERFMVFNGDTYTGIDIKDFLRFHLDEKARYSMALTVTNETLHQEIAEIENNRIIKFHERGKAPLGLEPLINSGVYIFEPEIFELIEANKNISLEKLIFPQLVAERKLAGYKFEGYFMDIGRPETYKDFKKHMIEGMQMSGETTIREALKKMDKNEEGLIFVSDQLKRLVGVVTPARITRSFIEGETNLEDPIKKIMFDKDLAYAREGDSPEKVAEIMLPRTNRLPILNSEDQIVDIVYRQEILEKKDNKLYRARSPLRISFSGGGTDKEDYFTQIGKGIVINATIDKYCHVTAKIRPDSLIRINPGQVDEEVFDLRKGKVNYDGKWDLVKAVVNSMKPDFGFDLHAYNDVPPKRGLGSSGSFAVMLTDLIAQMRGEYLTNDMTAEIAKKAELEELCISGGWQDQYAAKVGGFNLIEFSKNGIIPSSLALSSEVITELEESLILAYVGKTHESGQVHKEQEKYFTEKKEQVTQELEHLKDIAISIRDCLVSKNPAEVKKIGSYLHEAWLAKKELSGNISNGEIDQLYENGLKMGATGGKLLGAGNGGYILFFVPPEKRMNLKKSISQYSQEILDFKFERNPVGTQVWQVRG